MEITGFNPDIVLEYNERALVVQTVATPGYAIINRIMRSEVDKFIVDLINAPENDDKTVVARHKLSKAAAQFYTAVTGRVNYEIQQYTAAQGGSGKPVDLTEGVIDIGDPASTIDDFEIDEQIS